MSKAVVLLSGGMDSSTVLALALSQGFRCFALGLDYGQRHRSELIAAKKVSEVLGAEEYRVMKIPIGTLGGSALTDKGIKLPRQGEEGIPVTYVPARNTVFLSLSLAWAEILRADIIQLVKSIQVRKKEVERLTVEEEYEKHVDSFGEDEVEMRRAISQTAERLVLDPHTVEEYFRAFQDAAKQQRMDDSNKGLGLNRSGNARFRDTWRIGTYSFTCTVEYWASEDTANASWFGGTDYKIGGASIPCYAIHIKIDPTPEYYLLKEIHGWIRNVRPFKGPFGPGNIFQHWKTSQTGQEEEILKEIRPCLLYGFAGVRYEKDRTDAQLTAIAAKAEENLLRLKKQKHDEWVRSGGPEIEAEKARQKQEEQKMNEDWQDRFKRFKVSLHYSA